MSTPNTTLVTVAAVTVLGGLFAYAVYFDHKRRNDIEFRKNLRKEQKRVRKAKDQVAAAAPSSPSGPVTDAVIQAALDALKAEPLPNTTQEREAYFSEHIANGELLSQRGPPAYLEAALAFYRGLRVYPAPLELIMIYQKTVPEPIFNILMKLTTFEVKRRAEAYYEHFPPKSMNVEVKQVPVEDSSRGKVLKNVLVATRDFAVGETIYTEFPMASALDMDIEGKGTHCSQCMRSLSGITPLTLEDDPLNVAYCSPGCKAHANDQHHSLLFSLDPVPVLGFDDIPAPGPRRAAQEALTQHLKKSGLTRALIALRLFTHQTMSDTQKALRPLEKPESILPEPEEGKYGNDYTFGDHLERLRYLEVHADDKEVKMGKTVLDAALNAGEGLLTDEQYNTFKGKVAYNGIGVVYNGGRDRPRKNGSKEEDAFEWSRTPLGTHRQVGTALYRVSSYLTHSCTPSVRPTFPNGDYNLHLVASRSIAKGEELTMAYVEVARQAGESAEECCFRRRKQLAVGWSFVCLCARCLEERPKPAAKKDAPKNKETKSAEGSASEGEDGVLVPEHAASVKVEEHVQKFEEEAAPVVVAEAA